MDAEFFADFDFNRQAVRVPAGLTLAELASHRAVARIEILDRTRQAVAGVWHAVGCRWPLEKDKPFGSLPLQKCFFVDRTISPKRCRDSFDGGEVGLAANRLKHG